MGRRTGEANLREARDRPGLDLTLSDGVGTARKNGEWTVGTQGKHFETQCKQTRGTIEWKRNDVK